MNVVTNAWKLEDGLVTYGTPGAMQFSDTEDHWNQGLRRLMGISEEQARAWVEQSAHLANKRLGQTLPALNLIEQVEILRDAGQSLFIHNSPAAQPVLSHQPGPCGHPADTIWQPGLGNDDHLCVVGCAACQHGWLSGTTSAAAATQYEQEYFEGSRHGLGYGNYLQQQGWRMEKARRMLRQTQGACDYAGVKFSDRPRVLDVGSGYGFFRKAIDEAGWTHDGVELSVHACGVTKELFGYSTFNGILTDFVSLWKDRYELITLWDVLEHVENPVDLLQAIQSLLQPGGVCAIRTPNLMAVEREVFGRYYHSFKPEHLQFFSVQSLALLSETAGLRPAFITTQSNLLQGFSKSNMRLAEVTLRGADLFAVLVRT